jgi:hypothetical protein
VRISQIEKEKSLMRLRETQGICFLKDPGDFCALQEPCCYAQGREDTIELAPIRLDVAEIQGVTDVERAGRREE